MDMSEAFAVLELPGNPTTQEIKASFRKLAALHHPDRGGDQNKFIEVRTAYEVAVNYTPEDEVCPTCFNTGKVVHTHGWSSIKVNCPTCST
jgi:DnaJ-class molecular chaperone